MSTLNRPIDTLALMKAHVKTPEPESNHLLIDAADSSLAKGSTTLFPRTTNGSSPQQRIFPSPTTDAVDP